MLRRRTLFSARSLGMATALGLLTAPQVTAQTTLAQSAPQAPQYDLLSPPSSDARNQKKPPPYQKFEQRPAPADADQPTTFQPPRPASGAGATGFDSTNARERQRAPKANARTGAGTDRETQQTAPGDAAPPPASAYQKPAVSDAAKGAYAYGGAPGQPPIELGSLPPLRKKKKAAPVDPYDPIGMRSGGLLYYPALELIGGYDSNPARTPSGTGSKTLTVAPELRVRSDWERHEFKADLRGSYNWYDPPGTPSLDRPYFSGIADGRIDVFDGTRIDLQGRTLVSTDNPNSPNLQAGLAKLPIFTSFGATAGLGQKFNRLDLSVKGTVDRTVYQDSELTDGSKASNADRNFNQYGVTARAGYELTPGVMPFVQVAADTRDHDMAVDFFGFKRDSNGYSVSGGSTFELSRMLTGEISVGYLWRNYEDARLAPLRGVIANGSLTWTASALTTVKLIGSTTVGESDVPGVSGIFSRDGGAELNHSFRQWLIGTLKGGIGQDDYVGSSRVDNRYYVGGGLTYKLNRFVQIKGEARHEWLVSSEPINNYNANIFLLGLRLQY